MLASVHHIGILVRDLKDAYSTYHMLGYFHQPPIEDPVQGAVVQFLEKDGSPKIELIAPLTPDSHLKPKRSAVWHHTCYRVPDMENAIAWLEKSGMRVVMEPNPAVAFHGRRVAWMMGLHFPLMELLEW